MTATATATLSPYDSLVVHVDRLLDAEARRAYTGGQVTPLVPKAPYREGHTKVTWDKLPRSEKRAVMDRTVPIDADRDTVIALGAAFLGLTAPRAPRPPRPVLAPVVVIEARSMILCSDCGSYFHSRRPALAYCGSPCKPKGAKRTKRRDVAASVDGFI